jgi:hypothetical protein
MKKLLLAALLALMSLPVAAAEGGFNNLHQDIPIDRANTPPANEVQHYCEVAKPSAVEACMANPPTWPQLQTWKAQRQRAAGYRDPSSSSLCAPPYRVTRDGCQR